MTAVESSPVLLSMEIMFNYSWHIHTVLWHEHARECGTCVATGDWPNPLPTVTKQVQRDQKNTKKKKTKIRHMRAIFDVFISETKFNI